MLDFILCASTNLFRIVLIDRCVSVFLGKCVSAKKKILVCGIFYMVNTALFWEFRTVWINIVSNLAGIGAMVWLYTKSLKTNFFVTFTIYLVNCGCDLAVSACFFSHRDGEMHSQIYAAVTVFLFFICEILIEKKLMLQNNTQEAPNLSFILVPLCSIVMIGLLIYFSAGVGKGLAIVGVGLLLVNFLMLYLYNLLQRSITQKYETEMLKAQVQEYANQLNVILQGEERIKALRHDMKHHLNELMLLANKHGISEMQAYIDQMKVFIQNPNELVASGNVEIDSVLNYMLQKAEEKLKNVEVKVMLPEEIRHSFDINVLLGNLLENAIEAAEQTEQKYLAVHITLKRGVMRIKIENSYAASSLIQEEPAGRNRAFMTTKPFKEQHGIGLKNVERIVEKYNGTMTVTPKDDIFCVNLILYMSIIENEE